MRAEARRPKAYKEKKPRVSKALAARPPPKGSGNWIMAHPSFRLGRQLIPTYTVCLVTALSRVHNKARRASSSIGLEHCPQSGLGPGPSARRAAPQDLQPVDTLNVATWSDSRPCRLGANQLPIPRAASFAACAWRSSADRLRLAQFASPRALSELATHQQLSRTCCPAVWRRSSRAVFDGWVEIQLSLCFLTTRSGVLERYPRERSDGKLSLLAIKSIS